MFSRRLYQQHVVESGAQLIVPRRQVPSLASQQLPEGSQFHAAPTVSNASAARISSAGAGWTAPKSTVVSAATSARVGVTNAYALRVLGFWIFQWSFSVRTCAATSWPVPSSSVLAKQSRNPPSAPVRPLASRSGWPLASVSQSCTSALADTRRTPVWST
ncbi:hypothetical protein ACFQV2_27240 [Actinokineospora soli]|uniref:Uncharacterized protein n=1 Tax=Actinokineospora soli TaxID=1048753 RepID=A0ABW2TU02_9PSEU